MPINHFDLRSFDLNLLVAFDALMQERSVTRAAARLKVGQPAMSHSLSTLRALLQDELFVRVGSTLQPTSRANALAGLIRSGLAQMQSALHAPSTFDPAIEERTLRLGFSGELELLLIPDLTERLRRLSPGLRLHCQHARRDDVHRLLDDGALDLAVGCFGPAGARRHRSQLLFEPSMSCVFNAKKLPLKTPISRADYLSLPHAVVTLSDSLSGCMEAALDEIGAELNVVSASSEFMSVLETAATAPVIATLPTRTAMRFGPRFGLTLSPVPLPLRLPDAVMVWSAQLDQDPASLWVRQQIVAVFEAAAPLPAAGVALHKRARHQRPAVDQHEEDQLERQ